MSHTAVVSRDSYTPSRSWLNVPKPTTPSPGMEGSNMTSSERRYKYTPVDHTLSFDASALDDNAAVLPTVSATTPRERSPSAVRCAFPAPGDVGRIGAPAGADATSASEPPRACTVRRGAPLPMRGSLFSTRSCGSSAPTRAHGTDIKR
jgi:hypothetical protein